ncbi:unnamed protein product [Rotaria magnacalcarata]|uniref:NAD(P)(+)--arginine ADP-ribosyltransferase n=3 Tax=Rotaria magnacalcarata TaxID=392030 RepID=A0A815DAY4_9BILA|nr:unnamed protein product [Rotaria magnacalcarata]CAF1295493.1 unnamed protein product [Rotaria magnacalcarata]CAF1940092.1 unnamed protein product [Rotaria magnacalcarata]CAF2080636.1 unnamed protein product [Rotaria magnacalcarata]CAF3846190.1 unnamed protein product [Rotaria magnacalcarata]
MAVQIKTNTVRNDDVLNDHLETMSNLEGITLIWYDANLNVNRRKKLRITKQHIRSINNCVIFHKDEQDCINTIKSISNEKILLVTSGSSADSILSFDDRFVHRSVQAAFIFCHTKEKYQSLQTSYPKIIGIFDDPEQLKTAIIEEVDSIQAHLETFNFYNKNEQNSICNLSNRSATFLWLLVFKDVVIQQQSKDKKAKTEMIEICTNYYHGNKNEINLIKEFDQKYKPEHAIRWYTRPSFIYKLVNRALRTEDIEQLYIFRFYISDLCEQIANIQKQNSYQQPLTLYRGVRLPLDEVKKWQENEGKLISTNGFFSTSLSKKVAMDFALRRTETNMEESVLIEIECNQCSAAFAIIEKESIFSKEKEVLFDLGATFEVLSVMNSREENANINIWTVKVRSTQEGTELAQLYIQRNKRMFELNDVSEIDRWIILLSDMGQTSKSLKFFRKKGGTRPSAERLNRIFGTVCGTVNRHEDYDEALRYWEYMRQVTSEEGTYKPIFYLSKARIYTIKSQYDQALLELANWIQPIPGFSVENHILNAAVYMHIGEIYCLSGKYELALDYFNKANEVGKNCFPDDHIFFAGYFDGFANVYRERGEMHRAIEYYHKVVDMKEKYYPSPSSHTFYEMGCVYESLGDYSKSFEYYQRAAEIAEKKSIDDAKEFANHFAVIGRIHQVKGEFQKALDCFNEVLKIELQISGPSHDLVAQFYYKKGIVLELLNRNDEALTNYEQALNIQKQIFSDGHRHMARTLCRIGNQYRHRDERTLAKNYCDEALAMQERILPSNHTDIAFTMSSIGRILYDQGDYNKSLTYLWKALKMQKKFSSGEPHFYQISTLVTLADVYTKLDIPRLALQFLNDALSIQINVFSQQYSSLSDEELKNKIAELEKMIKP